MADSPQTTGFTRYAGQLIQSGIAPGLPYANLEEGIVAQNLEKIHGLSAKIKDVFIRETRVFPNPLDPYITKYGEMYGAGMEQASFVGGGPNKPLDGKCMPWGDVELASQTNVANFGYDVDVSVYDYEINKAVLNDEQAGAYVAQKLRTPLQTIALMKYRSWVQLLSDVVDGTRNITSYENSNDAASTAVTYNPTVKGYAKAIDDTGYLIPEVQRGVMSEIKDPETALGIAQKLQGMAADFSYSGNDMNRLNVETFTTSKPLIIMETKILNALNNCFANANAAGKGTGYGYAGFPTRSFREYISDFGEIVEIDSFASLPTTSAGTYANKRLGAVMIDRDAFVENVQYANVEAFRCTKERATGYSHQGSSTLSIYHGLDSFAMLFNTQE